MPWRNRRNSFVSLERVSPWQVMSLEQGLPSVNRGSHVAAGRRPFVATAKPRLREPANVIDIRTRDFYCGGTLSSSFRCRQPLQPDRFRSSSDPSGARGGCTFSGFACRAVLALPIMRIIVCVGLVVACWLSIVRVSAATDVTFSIDSALSQIKFELQASDGTTISTAQTPAAIRRNSRARSTSI